ncbi:hypothetical protein NQ318_003667, partial [Aromia moschata]
MKFGGLVKVRGEDTSGPATRKADANERMYIELQTRLDNLETVFKDFQAIQSEIEFLDESQQTLLEREQFENSYYDTIARAKGHILDHEAKLKGENVESRPRENAHHVSNVKLPSMTLPEFKGKFYSTRDHNRIFLSAKLFEKLNLRSQKINLPVIGINEASTNVSAIVQATIKSRHNAFQTELCFFILPKITEHVPNFSFDALELKIPGNLKLADPSFNILGIRWDAEADVLRYNVSTPNVQRKHVTKRGQRRRHERSSNKKSRCERANTRLDNLETVFKDFQAIQSEIEFLDESQQTLLEREQFENSYYDTIARAKGHILDHEAKLKGENVESRPRENAHHVSNVKLPSMTLPEFKGEYHKWLQFHDTFMALIDKNKNLSDIEKFYYLRGCLKGEAEHVLQALEASGENYKIAWDLLKERFENKRLIIDKHIQALFDITPISKESHISLRNLIDNYQKHLRALKQLGEPTDSWDRLIIHLLDSKLDPATKREWQQTSIAKGRILPSIADFTNFLTNHCQLLERVNADSSITLCWIASQPNTWQVFVSNRVSQIQQLTDISSWRHVPSEFNPADILSRGVEPHQLKDSKLWWNGPEWLSQGMETWPKWHPKDTTEIPERRKCQISLFNKISNQFMNFERYSILYKLQRIFAFCLRFVENIKTPKEQRIHGKLTIEELKRSQSMLIKIVQAETFSQEIHDLEKNRMVNRGSKLSSLNPFLDESKLIRVGGRIGKSSLEYDRKYPIVLPEKHHFTRLIIRAEHHRQLHTGAQAVLASLRLNYWVLNGRNAIRSQMTQHFWSRLSNEYLTNLQQRSKWQRDSSSDIKVGSMVVLKDENAHPLEWKLGRITDLHPGEDGGGVPRVVTIKTVSGVVRRAVHRVCVLPIQNTSVENRLVYELNSINYSVETFKAGGMFCERYTSTLRLLDTTGGGVIETASKEISGPRVASVANNKK